MAFTKIEHYEKEYLDHHHDSALNVTEGVESQPVVNPYFVRKKRRLMSTDEYVQGILQGNITILAQAITLIESNNPQHELHRGCGQHGYVVQPQACRARHRPIVGA